MGARLAGSTAGPRISMAAVLAVALLTIACTAPVPEGTSSRAPAAAGSVAPALTPSAPAPRLTYNPAQWPDPLDAKWLGGTWLLIAAAPAPRIEPLRYFLDFGEAVLVTDEKGRPLRWLGGVDSVEWSDPRGTWTVRLTAPSPCGPAIYSVSVKGGLRFAPIEESCPDRFAILVFDAWTRQSTESPRPDPSNG